MIFSKSLINCHKKGVHSVILQENPIHRIFFTTPDHELRDVNSVAAHPNHCDLTIVPLWGNIVNVIWAVVGFSGIGLLREYEFDSKIKGGSGEFRETGWQVNFSTYSSRVEAPIKLGANDIHTIYSPDDYAAWLIIEGKEYEKYRPLSYALTKPKIDANLYQPMTKEFFQQNFKNGNGENFFD